MVLTHVERSAAVDCIALLGAQRDIVAIHESKAHIAQSIVHGLEVLERVLVIR